MYICFHVCLWSLKKTDQGESKKDDSHVFAWVEGTVAGKLHGGLGHREMVVLFWSSCAGLHLFCLSVCHQHLE